MNQTLCHNCKNSTYLIVLKSGVTRCPLCNCIFGSEVLPIPTKIQSRVVTPARIDMNADLSLISAQLIARYISKGMTTAEVATQLGITKATVYAKLRKHQLLKSSVSEDFKINMSQCDILTAGLKIIKKSKKANDSYRPSDRYCKLNERI